SASSSSAATSPRRRCWPPRRGARTSWAGRRRRASSRLRKNAVSSALSGLGDPALACRPHGGDRIVRRGGRARIEASSYRLAREIAPPAQVVPGQPKGKHPAHPRHPAMAGLAQQANLFEPAEDLFDALTLPLAHQVAAVPRGAAIDRTRTLRGVLGHMRGYREAPEAVHEIPRVIALVGAERGPGRQLRGHRQGLLPLGEARRRRQAAIDRQAMAILHEDVALVVQLGLVAVALAKEPRLGIRRGGVRGITAAFAVKIHGRIARIIRWGRRRARGLEALET